MPWRANAQGLEPGADPLFATHDYGAADQVAFLAFTSIANDPNYVSAHILPLEQMAGDLANPATAPNFVWFGPNEDSCGEGPIDTLEGMLMFGLSQLSPTHQYNVPALDTFLRETIPVIMISPTWLTTKSVIVVTFDEDNNNMPLGFGNEGNHIVTVVIASPKAVAEGGVRPLQFAPHDRRLPRLAIPQQQRSLGHADERVLDCGPKPWRGVMTPRTSAH